MDLYQRFIGNTGRTIHKLDGYFPVYERHLGKYVGKPALVIEIGCGLGGSLEMWRDWFGSAALIVGLDYRQECKKFEADRIRVRIGHQADPGFLSAVVAECGAPDVVLDDGSHLGPDQVASFVTLYPMLSPAGTYIVEDLHCNYESQFDGGYLRADSFIEFAKPKLDEINRKPSATDFTRMTGSMHVYPSMIVFERGDPPTTNIARRVPEPPVGTTVAWGRP